MMSGIMTASLLPAYLTELPIPAAADDPMEDNDPTIDFDYAIRNNILNADDALKDIASKKKSSMTSGETEELKQRFPWQHATYVTAEGDSGHSLRTLLESTDTDDQYVSLVKDYDGYWNHWAGQKWEPIKITKDKVLDLNGHQFLLHYNANINHSKDDPCQEYSWEGAHYLSAFEIEEGATLTIIDSSEWRGDGKGTGKIGFYSGWCDHFTHDYKWYGHRDLFHVLDGNLIIYGGTYEAGETKMQRKEVSNFTWKGLTTAIGTAVGLGVNIAKYATGISTAEAAYQDVLEEVADLNAGTADAKPPKTSETQKNQPDGKDSGRNQSVSEKSAEKDKKIAEGNKQGTQEGENKADSEGKAKYDKNTKVAKAKNEIVNQAVNKDGIMGIVNEGFSLVDQIVDLFGTTKYPPVSNTIMGTAVRVGTAGTFASYGGSYIGNGSTPDTRNAVVEVMISPSAGAWTHDARKREGGRAYIYDGDFTANAGANVFNICRGIKDKELKTTQYRFNANNSSEVSITFDEHFGVEELFYQNQDQLEKGRIENGTVYDQYNQEIIPEPLTTANIQVRGGTFHCHYNVINMAKLERDARTKAGTSVDAHFRKFPGTSGSVNLGVDSFGEDIIRDGRIQIVDNAEGCLVLMDDQEPGKDTGLYHYRLFCGDNELRTKSYLKVYPNEAVTNSSNSMQLAYYLGTGTQTKDIFTDDEDNIRSPYRQMEKYFDFQIDDPTHRQAYSVKPNFRNSTTGQMDVYGEHVASSEVWYYPAPLDKDGKEIKDVSYGFSELRFKVHPNDIGKFQKWAGSELLGTMNRYEPDAGVYWLYDKDFIDDEAWQDVIDEEDLYLDGTFNIKKATYEKVRTNMKYFTYKVYQVDPLTRENLNANGTYGGDDPLLTVRYGCAPEETALKCKLPLDEVEQRIKKTHPEWQGYRAGEMYRIVLEVEEQIGIGEKAASADSLWLDKSFNDFGKKLRPASTTTSILFRCFEQSEQTQGEKLYLDTAFTPLQWPEYPSNMHTIPAGQKHTIELRNGKTGMVDWEADARVFDIYYQWWELDDNGKPYKLLAGTDNIFNDGLSKYTEFGTQSNYQSGMAEIIKNEKNASSSDDDDVYELKAKAKHKPGSWNLEYVKKSDGKRFQYANTVDPDDPRADTYVNPDYPNVTGLPYISPTGDYKWTAEQLHMYTSETTGTDILKTDKSRNLSLYNNDVTANQTDSCYIPKELIGKRIRVCAIALNPRWPLAFDKKQTFWSHTMEVCDPNSPEGYVNIQTDETEDFGEDIPATLSVQKLRDFYNGSKIASVTYYAYGKYKQFAFDPEYILSNLDEVPPVRYPKDFSDKVPDFIADENRNAKLKDFLDGYDDVCVVLGLTNTQRMKQIQGTEYSLDMVTDFVVLYPAPEIYGTFAIKPTGTPDPSKKPYEQPAVFSVTNIGGLHAGETVSSVSYYAYGKEKSFDGLSAYNWKDLPEARYPIGFTEKEILPQFARLQRDVYVRVQTSKNNAPYRSFNLTEQKPDLKGSVSFTYDKDLSYATFDHPVTLSLDDFQGLAYNEEIVEVEYRVDSATKVFSTEDDPDVFKDGIPSAAFPTDFYGENSANKIRSKNYIPYVTVKVARKPVKSDKSKTEQGTGTIVQTPTDMDPSTLEQLQELIGKTPVEGTVKRTEILEETDIIGTSGKTGTIYNPSDSQFLLQIDKTETREKTFSTENYEPFRGVIKAADVVCLGNEVEEIKVSDVLNGKYEKGITAFGASPMDATIGFDFSDYTNTNEKVAVLDQHSLFTGWTVIKPTGERGEATFTMKTPDGGSVSKTIRVIEDYDSFAIKGISAPEIGKPLDFDIEIPEDAPYHIKAVSWSTNSDTPITKDSVAEYYHPYSIRITLESEPCCQSSHWDASFTMEAAQLDGSVETISEPMRDPITAQNSSYARQEYDWDAHEDLQEFVFTYTYPAQSDHAASVIDEVHLDFPTEVPEGTYFSDYLKQVHLYTNGHDDTLSSTILPTYSAEAYEIGDASGYDVSLLDLRVQSFIKGMQDGLSVTLEIPEEMQETGDAFSKNVKIYINGEEGEVFLRTDGKITFYAPEAITVTDGKTVPNLPQYSMQGFNPVVGETVTLSDLLICSDDRVSVKLTSVECDNDPEKYFTYDLKEGTFTPIAEKPNNANSIVLRYTVSFDADGDGKPEYEKHDSYSFYQIYASKKDAPEIQSQKKDVKVTALTPDGKTAYSESYHFDTTAEGIPEIDNAFISGVYDSSEKLVSDKKSFQYGADGLAKIFKDGESYTVRTASVYNIEIHAGTDDVYATVFDADGNKVPGICISVDNEHYLCGEHLIGLQPDTDYTLYYKQGINGTFYKAAFRTGSQGYGVTVGKTQVTAENTGDLEKDGWHYDPETKTLTLKNLTLKSDGTVAMEWQLVGSTIPTYAAIAANDELTIELIGDNTLAYTGKELGSSIIYAAKNLTVTGTGNLTFANPANSDAYGLYSDTGDIILGGSGTLTFDRIGSGAYTGKGKLYYRNGTIDYKPIVKNSEYIGDYQLGNLISREDMLDFSGAVHAFTVSVASLNEKYQEVAETDIPNIYNTNRQTSNEENAKHYMRIVPLHSDTEKNTDPVYLESGSCEDGRVYHYSCSCGHIGTATFKDAPEACVFRHHEANAATCTESGNIEYWECEICGKLAEDENGETELTAEDLITAPLGHDAVHHAAKEAACTEAGSAEHWTCSRCGEHFADVNCTVRLFDANLTIPATGHEWIQQFEKAATCETDGNIAHWKCSHCGLCSANQIGTKLLKKEDVTVPAFGHSWSEWTVSKKATETQEGEEFRICSVCEEKETRVIPKKAAETTTAVTTTTKTTTTTAKATTTTAKATTTTAKATTTTAKATTTTAKATTTTAKATTTTAKATTTTAKATTTTAKATTTTAKATTTTAKATTTTAKATTTTAKTTTTTAKATTTTAKATTTTAKAITTTAKATTTTDKTTTTSATVSTTTTEPETTTTTVTTTTEPETVTTSTGDSETITSETTTTGETTPTEPDYLLGDINDDGEVNVADAQLTLNAYVKAMAGKDNGLTEKQAKAANVNGDQEISVDDAQIILLYYVKNTLSNTPTAWETLLGKQRQPQPYPDLTKPYADFLPEADGDPTEAETA